MAKYSELCLPEKIKLWFGLTITAPLVLAVLGAIIVNSMEIYDFYHFVRGVVSPENIAEYAQLKEKVDTNTLTLERHNHE